MIALGVEKVNIRWVRANTGLIKLGIVGVVRVVVVLSLTQRAQRARRGRLAPEEEHRELPSAGGRAQKGCARLWLEPTPNGEEKGREGDGKR